MSDFSSAQWFYGENGVQKGPYSTPQMTALMEAGVVTGQTLVWTEDMPGWAPLAETPLASAHTTAGAPPPLGAGGGYAGGGYAGGGYSGSAYGHGAYGAAGWAPPPSVDMKDAILTAFNKYATFSGRASRSEFWYFLLFTTVVGFALGLVDLGLTRGDFSPLSNLFSLAVLLPSIAQSVRRLHDCDRSGWWVLLALVPLVGIIVLIVFWAQRGTAGPNRFG
ncbi:DUF805 domain-containing protein [Azorhizobium oxalatiphilum]|nr:DUF805 domain-containing protein [Azorhizobium oxalatiphilum]